MITEAVVARVRAEMGDAAAIEVCEAHITALKARVQPPPWMTSGERKLAAAMLAEVEQYQRLMARIRKGPPGHQAPPGLFPVRFDTALPGGWAWDGGDPYTGRARRAGRDLYVQRYKAGGGVVAGVWKVCRVESGRVERGGFQTPMDAAVWADSPEVTS